VLVVDVAGEAREAVDQLDALDVDAIEVPARALATAVGLADLVLIDALAIGPERALVPAGSLAAAAVARHLDVPVWMIGGVGRLMPASMFDALVNRWTDAVDPLDAHDEVMALVLVDAVAGVAGVLDVDAALRHTDCPVAPELFRLAG
jgi:translation initiation factor 2B subunit (eIF-2B alpha/beta/delta family)